MLILLDENLPHDLRHRLREHDIRTVAYQGWASIKNGQLLSLAEAAGFDFFVTGDKGIRYQQNRRNAKTAIILLSSTDYDLVLGGSDEIRQAIEQIEAGALVWLLIG